MALLRRITLIVTSVAAIAVGIAVVPATSSLAAVTAAAPRLLSPANETDTPIKDLILRWAPVAGASEYEVQVSRNQAWTNNVIALPNGGKTVATVLEMPIGLPHSTYFWRVRATVGGAAGAWSRPWQFLREWETQIQVVRTPSGTDPTLSWAPVRDASLYHVIFDTTPVTADDVLNGTDGCFTANTSFTPGLSGVQQGSSATHCEDPALVDGTTYYWALAAFDDSPNGSLVLQGGQGCGTKIPECDAFTVTGGSFKYQAPPSGTGTQLTGLKTTWHSAAGTENVCGETTVCPMTPTFSWTPVPGADFYLADVYLDRDATTLYREYTSQTATFTPPDQFQDAQPSRPYYWRVGASTCGGTGVQCSAPPAASQGCPAPSSGGSTATTPSPAPSTTPAPSPTITGVKVAPPGPGGDQSMQGGTTATVTITGTNISNGACVIASGGVVRTVPSVAANTMTFSYYAPVPGGSVTFVVENPDGTTSGVSTAINVTSSAHSIGLSAIQLFQKRSGAVRLQSPANGADLHGHTVTFKWADYIASGSQGSYDPETYQLELAHDANFTDRVSDISGIDLTQYTATFTGGAGPFYWRVNALDESGNLLTWSKPREVTLNRAGPVVDFVTTSGVGVGKPLVINFSHLVRGVSRRTLKVVPASEPVARALSGTLHPGATPTQFVFTPKHPLAVGGKYVLWVSHRVVDVNHNPAVVKATTLRANRRAHNSNKGWIYSNGWTRRHSSGSFSGSDMEAGPGSTARIRIQGENVQIAACKGPSLGTISFSVAGITRTVDEHHSFTRCGVYVWRTGLPGGVHTLRVHVLSGRGSLDSLTVR